MSITVSKIAGLFIESEVKANKKYCVDVLGCLADITNTSRITFVSFVFQQNREQAYRGEIQSDCCSAKTPKFISPDIWPPQ